MPSEAGVTVCPSGFLTESKVRVIGFSIPPDGETDKVVLFDACCPEETKEMDKSPVLARSKEAKMQSEGQVVVFSPNPASQEAFALQTGWLNLAE